MYSITYGPWGPNITKILFLVLSSGDISLRYFSKYKEQYFSNVRAPRSMDDAVHVFGLTLCRDRLGFESTEPQSMRDAVHPSRMKIIRIVLYKDRFDVNVTTARDFTIKIVLNRKDHRLHASRRTW